MAVSISEDTKNTDERCLVFMSKVCVLLTLIMSNIPCYRYSFMLVPSKFWECLFYFPKVNLEIFNNLLFAFYVLIIDES